MVQDDVWGESPLVDLVENYSPPGWIDVPEVSDLSYDVQRQWEIPDRVWMVTVCFETNCYEAQIWWRSDLNDFEELQQALNTIWIPTSPSYRFFHIPDVGLPARSRDEMFLERFRKLDFSLIDGPDFSEFWEQHLNDVYAFVSDAVLTHSFFALH